MPESNDLDVRISAVNAAGPQLALQGVRLIVDRWIADVYDDATGSDDESVELLVRLGEVRRLRDLLS